MEDKTFELTDNQGNKITCQILHTFKYNNENYMIYTDGLLDKDKNYEVLASKYIINKDKITLLPIENNKEWDIIDAEWEKYNE